MKTNNPFARAFPFTLAWAAFLWCAMVVVSVPVHFTTDFGTAMDVSFAMFAVLLLLGAVPLVLCAIGMVLYDATHDRRS